MLPESYARNPSIVKTIATFFISIYVLALLLTLISFRGDGARAAYFRRCLALRLPDAECPPATVIVPVKGMDEGLAANLAALAAQDYPDYELIVVVRDAADLPEHVLPAKARLLVAGPGDAGTSHKITNLLAAVDNARAETALLAFADSDGRPTPQWLRALAAALKNPTVGAATGYRWYVPEPPDVWSNRRGCWNAAAAGTMGPADIPFCWGGAMAISRADFDRLQIPRWWLGEVSDDLQLGRAVHAAGLRIAFAPGAVVPCHDHCGQEFMDWARRQLILTRIFAPRLWAQALIAHLIYVCAIVFGLLGLPDSRARWVAAVILIAGMVKAYRRAEMFHLAHPHLPSQAWTHTRHVSFVTFVWLYTLLASATSNSIVWRGVRYKLRRSNPPR